MEMSARYLGIALPLISGIVWVANPAVAQGQYSDRAVVVSEDVKVVETAKAIRQAPAAQPQPPKDAKAEKDKEGKKDEEKKDGGESESTPPEAGASPVKRESSPGFTADPSELDIKPDTDGRVQFSWHGQKWRDVLQWLASVSGKSLDWQELPPDYRNVRG